MEARPEVGGIPLPEFQEQAEDSLVEVNLNDLTELWLIQLPEDQCLDFDGQELSLELNQDGRLGSLEGTSGKHYDLVSFSSQQSDATVFLSSSSGPRIAGKISRHVSLVHYPEPDELKTLKTDDLQMKISHSSMTSLTNSSLHLSTPQRNPLSQSRSRSTHSSRKSSLSDVRSKPSKRGAPEPSRYSGQSTRDSGELDPSGITSSGLSGQSYEKKSKRKTNSEA